MLALSLLAYRNVERKEISNITKRAAVAQKVRLQRHYMANGAWRNKERNLRRGASLCCNENQ